MCDPDSKFKERNALESWKFVWKMNFKNEEDFRWAWEERKKEKYQFFIATNLYLVDEK